MHKRITLLLFILFIAARCFSQAADRIGTIEQRLNALAVNVPGLNETVQLNISNVGIQEYLSALAKANGLSINADPKLNFKLNNTFNNVTAINVLTFLAKQYNLDITTVGNIIMVTAYQDPNQFVKAPPKEIGVKYDQLTNALTLELNNDTLGAVARKITQVSGKNIVVPNSLQTKRVSGFISQAPFETAMDKLAYSNEMKMVKTNDGFYLFQPLNDGEELYVNGDKNTDVRRTFKPAAGSSGGTGGSINLFSKTVDGRKLITADATNASIADLIKNASQELGKNYFLYTDIKGTITTHISNIGYDDFLSSLLQGTDYTFRQENNVYMIGDSKLEGLRTVKAIQLQNRSIDTVVSMIPADWKKSVEIKEFREQNTLLISGSSSRITEIESLVKQLDVLVPVVTIEVTLIDIHKNRSVATGIAAGVSDSVKTGGTILSGLDFTMSANSVNSLLDKVGGITSVNLGHVVPNFYVNLKALESNNNVEVRSVPKLTALNGHSATLSIGNTVWYKNINQNIIPSSATTITSLSTTYSKSDANLSIDIKPVVSGNEQVTLGIKVDISDFTSIPTDGSPPPTSTSKFESSIRVNNEDMIVLGGIERNEKDDNSSGIPLLSRIPVLKWIFSSKTKTNSKIVTLVFIKPTILR
jgi:type IV pilus assembly protein PilQ